MMVAPKPLVIWPWALAVFLGTFLFYVPSLSSGLVYDAETQILNDSYIHDTGHFPEVVTFRVLGRDVVDGTRPVHLFFFMTDALVWKFQPFGYHLTSILFHCLNTTVLFLLLIQFSRPSPQSLIFPALCAFVFALHPVNVEAVAEVSYREDLLTTCFLLVSWWLAAGFGRWQGKALWLGGLGIVLASVLAAGAKETGYAAPFLLGLYWWLFRRQDSPRRWAVLLGTVFVAVTVFVIARFTLPPQHSQIFLDHPGYLGGSLASVFTIQPRLWAFLIENVFWPRGLSADYVPQNLASLDLLMAGLILVIFISLQLILALKSRVACFGAVVFWIGLAPVSNFIPLFRPLADRFLYLPMVGIALLLYPALGLASQRFHRFLIFFLAIGIFALGVLSWQRQSVFANSLNLWQDALAKSPASPTAADNLGYAWLDRAEYGKAGQAFQLALRLSGDANADAWAGAAIAMEKLGRPEDAEKAMRQAVAVDPMYAKPDQLVRSLVANSKNAAILAGILARMPSADSPPPR